MNLKKTALALLPVLAGVLLLFQACNNSNPPVVPALGFTPNPTNTPCGWPSNTCTPTFTCTHTPTSTPTNTPCTGVFGNNAVEGDGGSNGGTLYLDYFVAGSNTSLTKLSFYAYSAYCSYEMAVYSDNSVHPNNLLAQTGVHTSVYGWNTVDLPSPVALVSGTAYWLGTHYNGDFAINFSGPATMAYQSVGTTYGSLPAAYSGGGPYGDVWLFSIYGTTCP